MKKRKQIVKPVVSAVMSVVVAGLFTACAGGNDPTTPVTPAQPFEWPAEMTVTSTNESSYKSL